MASTVIRTSRQWIGGDCFEVRESTRDGKTTVSRSPEPDSACGPKPLMTASGKPGNRPRWATPLLAIGLGVGIAIWWRKK